MNEYDVGEGQDAGRIDDAVNRGSPPNRYLRLVDRLLDRFAEGAQVGDDVRGGRGKIIRDRYGRT